jgi:hypothetical protein
MDQDPEGPDKDRDESEAEREDRRWEDMLQELRVMQTSAQLTAGFLLTLPFQQSFSKLSDNQERFYLFLVMLAALVTALVAGGALALVLVGLLLVLPRALVDR